MKKLILAVGLAALLGGATATLAGDGRGYMGVTVVGIGQDEAGKHDPGVYITAVQPGSGAEAAGLLQEDRILSINGVAIGSTPDLDTALGGSIPGQAVTISVLRAGSAQTFDVVLGDKPQQALALGEHGDQHFGKWVIEAAESTPRMGVALQPLGSQLAAYFNVTSGMLVTRVIEDSGAWRAGLQAGDVILEVNGAGIETLGDIRTALKDLEAGDTVDVAVQRRGSLSRFDVTLEDAASLSQGEMTFNIALQGEGHGDGSHDIRVDLRGIEGSPGDAGEPLTLRLGEASARDALQHRIHQLTLELHRLQEELNSLPAD